jgi:hypothetical protein
MMPFSNELEHETSTPLETRALHLKERRQLIADTSEGPATTDVASHCLVLTLAELLAE